MKAKTFDAHNINDGSDYSARFPTEGGGWGLPAVSAHLAERLGEWPLVSGIARPGHLLVMEIEIVELSNLVSLRDQLLGWLDVDEPARLVVTEDDGSRERYVMALPVKVLPRSAAMANVFVVSFRVSGDVKWRSTSTSSVTWSITATGQTKVVNNGGDAEAYPTFTITVGDPAEGFQYRRWSPITWVASAAGSSYPVVIGGLDTAALVSAGKMQADGDDLRVMVNGVEVDRWLVDMNTASTDIWINLDFEATVSMTLATAIAASGNVEIEVNEDISTMPSAGILLIGSEAFLYGAKNNTDRKFTSVTRAAKGTTAAAHTAGVSVHWIQNDVWLLYGDSSATAPTVDDNYKPAFALATSDNNTWDYEEFGEDDGLRTAAWLTGSALGSPIFYTASHATTADPWEEMGVYVNGNEDGRWKVYNPCGIYSVNFQNGEKRTNDRTSWSGDYGAWINSSNDGSSWTREYTIPAPTANDAWETWSWTGYVDGKYLMIRLKSETGVEMYLEVADVTLGIDNSPTVSIQDEQSAYDLDCTITNTTTGEAIGIELMIEPNGQLEIDTDLKTITDLGDDSSQFQALTVINGPRRKWLKLEAGDNTLQYDEAETDGVELTIEWEKRWR